MLRYGLWDIKSITKIRRIYRNPTILKLKENEKNETCDLRYWKIVSATQQHSLRAMFQSLSIKSCRRGHPDVVFYFAVTCQSSKILNSVWMFSRWCSNPVFTCLCEQHGLNGHNFVELHETLSIRISESKLLCGVARMPICVQLHWKSSLQFWRIPANKLFSFSPNCYWKHSVEMKLSGLNVIFPVHLVVLNKVNEYCTVYWQSNRIVWCLHCGRT